MRRHIFMTIVIGLIAFCRGAIQGAEPLSKLTSTTVVKQPSDNKDLEASASDRTFLIGREYGYGSGGYGGGYGNYPSINGGYYNRGNGLNSVYRGYQTGNGYGGITGGGNTGWGYYGGGGYGSGYGGLGGYGSTGIGYGGYEDGYTGPGGRGYNRWNSLDGYGGSTGIGYGGTIGSGYGSSGSSGYGASTYPYAYRGGGYGSYSGYPSGYRGYS